MSRLLNFTATGTIGPPTGGFRMGMIAISGGSAAAAATITEIIGTATFTRMVLGSPISTIGFLAPADSVNGFQFDGPLILSALSGAGASVIVEEM